MTPRIWRRSLAAAGLIAGLLAGPAAGWAQKPGDSPTPVAATARADADRILSQAGQGAASRYFSNVTRPGGPATLMHGRSGLICIFDAQPVRGQLMVYPASGGAAEGDDVSCNLMNSAGQGYLETLYATRYVDGDLQSHFQGAVAEIRARFGALEPWRPAMSDASSGDSPPSLTVRYQVMMDGQPTYTRLSMAQVGAWTVMLRFSAPIGEGEGADQAATRAFEEAVAQVVRGSAS